MVLTATFSRSQARYDGGVELFAGRKWLSSADWAPVDQQPEIGVLFSFAEERTPVRLAIDVLASRASADDTDPLLGPVHLKGSTFTYGLGVRKVWGRRLFRPHLGAGGIIMDVRAESRSSAGQVERSDTGVGGWVDAGFAFRLAARFDIGLDLRYDRAQVNLGRGFEDIERSAGGFHAGLILGYAW